MVISDLIKYKNENIHRHEDYYIFTVTTNPGFSPGFPVNDFINLLSTLKYYQAFGFSQPGFESGDYERWLSCPKEKLRIQQAIILDGSMSNSETTFHPGIYFL